MYIWLAIVPVISHALSKLEDTIKITVLDHTFSLVTRLPFSWQCFYFSALFFSLATVVYHLACPRIIKEFKDFREFYDSGRHIAELEPYTMEVRDEGEIFSDVNVDSLTEEQARRRTFWDTYNRARIHNHNLHFLCTMLLITGSALMLWVFLSNLTWVFNQII